MTATANLLRGSGGRPQMRQYRANHDEIVGAKHGVSGNAFSGNVAPKKSVRSIIFH